MAITYVLSLIFFSLLKASGRKFPVAQFGLVALFIQVLFGEKF